MSSIFPLRETVTPDENREPRLVDLDDETADEVFEALSSQTTRTIFLELHRNPQTTSDLADATDTSVQNVQYHLEKLTDADLVEVVDTWYSERGTEMKVYAPEDESLVLFAGQDKQRTLRSLLDRVVGVLAFLVPGSVLAALGTQQLPTGREPDTTPGVTGGTGSNATPAGNSGTASTGEEAGTGQPGSDIDIAEYPDTGEAVSQDAGNASVDAAGPRQELSPGNNTTDAVDETVTAAGNVSQTVADNASEMGTNATATTEAAVGVDPAVAAGLGFFVGGLLVFLALTAWYGTP